MSAKNCQTARGNVRRGLFGDGRRTKPEYDDDYENGGEQ